MSARIVKRLCLAGVLSPFAAPAFVAAQLNLADKPLVTSGSVDPNVMFAIDSSGSMEHVVPSAAYDPNDPGYTYFCSSGRYLESLSRGEYIRLRIKDGVPRFDVVNSSDDVEDEYDWSNSADYYWWDYWGDNGKKARCFDPDKMYPAALTTGPQHGNSSFRYTGHYLNYYFGSKRAGWWGVKHPDEPSRLEVAINSFNTIVDSVTNIRVGLASFLDRDGADMRQTIQPIGAVDSSARTQLKNSANGIVASGGTPIAETFHTLGRYFIGDRTITGNLTLHPDGTYGDSASKAATAVFHKSPGWGRITNPDKSSPISQGEWCQQNFVVMLSDGQQNWGAYNFSDSNSEFLSSGLADYDGDCTGQGTSCGEHDKKTTGDYNYLSRGSDYMDDVALALYDMDLRPDVNDSAGRAVKNNIKTYMVGLADEDIKTDPLFRDTARHGGTGGPIFVDDEYELLAAFDVIISDIHAQSGSMASVAFNSSQLSSDSAVFQAKFNSGRWSGSLSAMPLTDTGTILPVRWDAADKLDDQPWASRNIMTKASVDGVPFLWDYLTEEQRNDLGYDGVGARDDPLGRSVLAYLRGDRSKEGGLADSLRVRASALGDIVNSTPVFVGAPELHWPDYQVNNKFGTADKPYRTFKDSAAKDRTGVIYVGANDGMLHGFDASLGSADGGKEVLGYVPSFLFSTQSLAGLHHLADRRYDHKFYVDGTPTVSDVFVDSDWRTILVSGVGAGGKGLFALDVTDPSTFNNLSANADDILLWEFTDTDLGYTFSQPSVAMMQNGKWAVVVGNGYNNNGSGTAQLYILFIEEGMDGHWAAGDFIKIDTEIGSTANPNGLSTPRVVDLDRDGVADRIYAGDLRGNLWAFDVSASNTGNWSSAYRQGQTPKPMFTATDASSNGQPITSAPVAARRGNDVLVLFGTGQYLENADVNSTDPMTYYAVRDSAKELTRADLVSRTVTQSGSLRSVTGDAIDWSTQHGWYIDLMARDGERVISDSQIRRDVVFFNTVMPNTTACEAGGKGWLMSLKYDTGLAPDHAVFDANNDGVINDDDLGKVGYLFEGGLPSKSGMLGDKQYTPGSKGDIDDRKIDVGAGGREGRLSWEEVFKH